MREGSAPNFAPPVEEGIVFTFEDESGDKVNLEFLGLIIHNDRRYGFFYAVGDGGEAGGSGEVTILEVTEFDEDGQPAAFELVMDDAIAAEVYEDFKVATKDLYDFQYVRFSLLIKKGRFRAILFIVVQGLCPLAFLLRYPSPQLGLPSLGTCIIHGGSPRRGD